MRKTQPTIAGFEDGVTWPRVKDRRRLLEVPRGQEKMNSPLEPPKGMQPS